MHPSTVAPFNQERPDHWFPRHRYLQVIAGCVYLGMTIALSLCALSLAQESASNDYYWPGYNTTGTQTFLADLFNAKLSIQLGLDNTNATMIDTSTSFLYKDYTQEDTLIDANPSLARILLLGNIPLPRVIATLRNNSFNTNIKLNTPYCWVDFTRTFELAHTTRRQVRCAIHDMENGAVYLEALLRNTAISDLVSSQFFAALNYSVFDALTYSTVGQSWLATILSHTIDPVITNEVAFWTQAGVTRWQSQVINAYQRNIENSIGIQNALGLTSTIKINNVAYVRNNNWWTTQSAYVGLWNEIIFSIQFMSCSLVRGAPNFYHTLGIDWDELVIIGPLLSPGIDLTRQYIGPFGSIDIRYVSTPHSLVTAFAVFNDLYHSAVLSNAARLKAYGELNAMDLNPIPHHWHNIMSFGGNPMCPYGGPTNFIQPAFGFYDDCSSPQKHTVAIEKDSAIFAVLMMDGLSKTSRNDICSLCPSDQRSSCSQTLLKIASLYAAIQTALQQLSSIQLLWLDILTLNATLIQFTTRNATELLLVQAIFTSTSDPWSYFGWIAMYEWVLGKREVHTLDGDVGSFTMISPSHPFDQMTANPLELPRTACTYVWYITLYVTAILVCIGCVLLFYGLYSKFQVEGLDLFYFNRVVGSVWIGRPFIFVRGMTAAVILSTANVALISEGGFAQLKVSSRSWFNVMLLAGETLWLTYAVADFCLPLAWKRAKSYSPLNSFLAWLVIVILETTYPVAPLIKLETKCTISTLGTSIHCTNGEFMIGSTSRLLWIIAIQPISLLLAYFAVYAMYPVVCSRNKSNCHRITHHLLIPVASQAYITRLIEGDLVLDRMACVMSGILPMGRFAFDIKIWSILAAEYSTPGLLRFPEPKFQAHSSSKIGVNIGLNRKVPSRFRALVGLMYIISTVASSYIYLGLTESTMANDFWWAAFNNTGTQSFVCNWFTTYLQFTNVLPPSQIDKPIYGDESTPYNLTETILLVPALYASSIQNEINTLVNIVQGLRNMNACDVPWIFTAYCYVDFNQQWQMANSAERQERCTKLQTNGATYLEAVLRNSNWDSLNRCWGYALEVGVFSFLRTSSEGQQYIQIFQAISTSPTDEVNYWRSKNIISFETQWQNFKTLGIVESISVQNAFGMAYPITLKKSNYSLHVASQTSLKMYWGFANDLLAVSSNSSTVGGMSLVRNSRNFAFQNMTLETVFMQSSSLDSPLGRVLGATRAAIGPFGSIDIKRIACPQSLQVLHRTLFENIHALLSGDDVLSLNFTAIPGQQNYSPMPHAWSTGQLLGGDPLCEFGSQSGNQILEFVTANDICGMLTANLQRATKLHQMMSVLATGLLSAGNVLDTATICAQETWQPQGCLKSLGRIRAFLSHFDFPFLHPTSIQLVKVDVGTVLQVTIIQFVQLGGHVTMNSVNLFSETETRFEFFSWLYLFEWVEGSREVLLLHGQNGNVTTLSGLAAPIQQSADPLEIPINVAYYIRCAMLYITFLLLVVGSVATVYIIGVRGHIEMWNMMEINRVAGVIWIGRPLVLLRGITALCLLSTVSLKLMQSSNGLLSYFVTTPRPWYIMLMSCGEVTWLIYIINDVFSPLTQQYTYYYSYKSSNVMWLATFVWSVAAPVSHQVSIDRQCYLDAVDFQAKCHSGIMKIGSVTRFEALICMAFGACAVCYGFERAFQPQLKRAHEIKSLFLHATANNNLDFSSWKHFDVFYIDKASAVLNGLLTIHVGSVVHIFDVKSWRMYAFDTATMNNVAVQDTSFEFAIPLVE
ncbi:Aste57867_1265 [Aphanomyces stellatus]|uniref:Aste57867_1265 protein n=1 Tax=Aphanomyces stellatus TaxID=120398 RepID=A0A485K851_9STRA|nr:hypothetical protein As57867_001264 [Aphanomyces stellatus]VFT78484.1 Aste57867_1265 [Aphanomyces stellatus]